MTQPAVGVLMLETQFPRPLGDIGNPNTWAFPVHFATVSGASAQKVVREDPSLLLPDFVAQGRRLIAEGCAGIATSCGFLSLLQEELKAELGVPFASSALMQLPMVEALLPVGQRAGILTISAESLTSAHLRAAGARDDTAMAGLPVQGAFASAIFADSKHMDFEACRKEMIAAAVELIEGPDEIGAIVLECTNMAPYAADVARATGRPVYSIVSFLNWFQAGLVPPPFPSMLQSV